MKNALAFFSAFWLMAASLAAQVRPYEQAELTDPQKTDAIYTQERVIGGAHPIRKITLDRLEEFFGPTVKAQPLGYAPDSVATIPTADWKKVARTPGGRVFFIDSQGAAIELSKGGASTSSASWQPRTVVATVGSATVTLLGSVPTDVTRIKFKRGGLDYKVGLPGCSDCHVVKSGASSFTFYRAAASYDHFWAEVLE